MDTILAFGDSILKGVVYENGSYRISGASFPKLCEKALNITIDNKAKFGSTISKGETIVNRNIQAIHSASGKYVLLEFGGNDCDFNWKEISDHPDRGHPPANTIVNFRTTYIRMIRAIKSTGKMPVLLSLPPVDPSRYFEHISRNRSKDNIRRWLQNDIQFIANWHEIYNIEIIMLGQTCQIPVIDITSVFLERKNYTTCLCSDGIHPNVEGHKLIADMLLSYVSSHRITFS